MIQKNAPEFVRLSGRARDAELAGVFSDAAMRQPTANACGGDTDQDGYGQSEKKKVKE